jgi:hypothetical protein
VSKTYVRVVHSRDDYPVAESHSDDEVYLSPPWRDKRRSDPGDLTPIEGEETETKTGRRAKELIDDNVICTGYDGVSEIRIAQRQEERRVFRGRQRTWFDPADPREVAQCSEEVACRKLG